MLKSIKDKPILQYFRHELWEMQLFLNRMLDASSNFENRLDTVIMQSTAMEGYIVIVPVKNKVEDHIKFLISSNDPG